MRAYRKLYFRKNFMKCLFVHAADISTSVHSNHKVVVVGAFRVACYWEFVVLSFIELSPVGIYMINCLKHIYPWWIALSDSIFINVSVIIVMGALNKIGSLGGSFLALAYTVELSNFVACFAFCILGWTPLPWLVSCFPHLLHLPSIPGGFLD